MRKKVYSATITPLTADGGLDVEGGQCADKNAYLKLDCK